MLSVAVKYTGSLSGNTVPTELAGVSNQSGGMGQGTNRNGSIISRHTSECVLRNERSFRTEARSAKRSDYSGGTGSDYYDIQQVCV